jgi:hypothetical protein
MRRFQVKLANAVDLAKREGIGLRQGPIIRTHRHQIRVHAREAQVNPIQRSEGERVSKNKAVIVGWIILLMGTALWIYGYFATGNPSLIDWRAVAPWWIADYLPNIESEIGMTLVFASMVPIYWPYRQ